MLPWLDIPATQLWAHMLGFLSVYFDHFALNVFLLLLIFCIEEIILLLSARDLTNLQPALLFVSLKLVTKEDIITFAFLRHIL